MLEAWSRMEEDKVMFGDNLTMEEVNSLERFTFVPIGGDKLEMQVQHGAGSRRKTAKVAKKTTRVRKDDIIRKTAKTNRKMTDWLIPKPVRKMTMDFGLQEMEVDNEEGWGVGCGKCLQWGRCATP